MSRLKALAKKYHLKLVFFLLGLGLFALLIYQMKPALVWSHLTQVGWNFSWIMGVSILWSLAYVWAWLLFIPPEWQMDFWLLFRIKAYGESLNNLTPLGWGGGDPARIYLLKEYTDLNVATASVIVDRTLNNFAAVLILGTGIAVGFAKFEFNFTWKLTFSLSFLLLSLLCVFFYIRSQQGLFSFFLDTLKKLHLKRKFSPATLEHAQSIDHYISNSYRSQRGKFLLAFLLQIVARLLGVWEIHLAAKFLGYPLDIWTSYLLASLTIALNLVFFFIPGNIGVLEKGSASFFTLLALDPTVGASIQIIRRIRTMIWTGLGFILVPKTRETEELDQKAKASKEKLELS